MPEYRRIRIKGGCYFFTVTLADRNSDLLIREVGRLRESYRTASQRLPFETIAICILPNHLHAIWQLPERDVEYSKRWNSIKTGFSRGLPADHRRSASKIAKREKGLWQRRFWEHAIRDEQDLARHIDYIHFNPVKHGLVPRVCDWPHSSFHRYVADGTLPNDWGGDIRTIDGSFGE
jgi:putative transposase